MERISKTIEAAGGNASDGTIDVLYCALIATIAERYKLSNDAMNCLSKRLANDHALRIKEIKRDAN